VTVFDATTSFAETEFIAADFAPDRDRSTYIGPAAASFPDPGADQDAAPDITAVTVTDAKDGWISFAISTPNYATLPGEAVLLLSLDLDNKAATGDNGAEGLITAIGGEVQETVRPKPVTCWLLRLPDPGLGPPIPTLELNLRRV